MDIIYSGNAINKPNNYYDVVRWLLCLQCICVNSPELCGILIQNPVPENSLRYESPNLKSQICWNIWHHLWGWISRNLLFMFSPPLTVSIMKHWQSSGFWLHFVGIYDTVTVPPSGCLCTKNSLNPLIHSLEASICCLLLFKHAIATA